MSASQKKKLLNKVTHKHFRSLTLSKREMADHNYPDPHADLNTSDGWIRLDRPGDGTERMFAIDCEMVVTERGRELARCTVVDATCKTV